VLQADEVAVDQLGQDALAVLGILHVKPVEQRGIQGGVTQADPIGLQARRIQGVA